MSGTAVSISAPRKKSPTEDSNTIREKEKEPSATSFVAPVSKRRRDGQSVSEGAVTSSSLTQSASSPEDSKSPSKRAKKGFFSKFTFFCKSCVNQEHTHPVDLDEGASQLHDNEKQALKDGEPTNHGTHSSSSTTGIYASSRPPESSLIMEAVIPPILPPLTIATTVPDGEVIVPPTPTKQLLPLSETDGLTSGAVQPPGSTGENLTHAHYEKRISRDVGDDSDSSFSEEGNFHEMITINEVEDEEQRLIRLGGTGIPIGPVSELPGLYAP